MVGVARRRRTLRLIAVVGVLGLLYGILPVAPAAAATDKLPDLKVHTTTDFYIQTTSSGRRLLRFSGMMLNVGRGPLEIRADRASTKSPWVVNQVIYETGGGTRKIQTTATMQWAGDGHNHWHVQRMLTYHLWSATGSQPTLREAKLGYCFFDTNRRNTSLPGAPKAHHYRKEGCGKPGSLHTLNGISVGWADLYPANFVLQWIDITGVPAGTYTVRGEVDLYNKFLESSETNNCTWSRISFGASGSKVKVLATGSACVNDHDSTPYAADISWALANGISGGCDADMFCPYDSVTREQLASFIARAVDLPATTTDFFTDDSASTHQADINRVAAAGILTGCTATHFCPASHVTRATMATVLARALAFPTGPGMAQRRLNGSPKDAFTDDNASPDEANINAVAQAGIMTGCTATTFCPTVTVKRGETMRFLDRAFGSGSASVQSGMAETVTSSDQGLVLASFHRTSAGLGVASQLAADEAPAGWTVDPDAANDVITSALPATSGPLLTCVIPKKA